MESPYTVLGVSPNATRSEIESAYRDKYHYWNSLRSIPNRATEATEMLDRLEFAREQLLGAPEQQVDGLVDPASGPLDRLGVVPLPNDAGTKDRDVCPQCGQWEDSPDAVYCTNKACRFELKPCCPGCSKRIAWYKEICPYCGIDIEEKREEHRQNAEAFRNTQIQELKTQLQDLQSDLI